MQCAHTWKRKQVFQQFAVSISKRSFAANVSMRHEMVWKVLRTEIIHPSTCRRTNTYDMPIIGFRSWSGVGFLMPCWMIHSFPHFFYSLMKSAFWEKAWSTQNAHKWSSENPHSTLLSKVQGNSCINIWAGIEGNNLLRPCLQLWCL